MEILIPVILIILAVTGLYGLVWLSNFVPGTGGGSIPSTDLTFALRKTKLPGLHVADDWKDWVENWAGESSMARQNSQRSLQPSTGFTGRYTQNKE